MAQKIKKWRIGEQAVGGIIEVTVAGKVILVKALEYWNPKNVISSGSTILDENDKFHSRNVVREFLQSLTTDYYVDKILDWVSDNSIVPKTDW